MENDVYKRLATHLDDLPGGFPSTQSGVEIRILKRLFLPDEAELATHMTLIPETPRVVARRAGIPSQEAHARLEAMARKGLIFRIEKKPLEPAFMAAQFVVGIWEFHVDDLDIPLIKDMEEYIPILFGTAWKKPQMRTIPVGTSITPGLSVLPYEHAEHLLDGHQRFALLPCICNRERKMVGQGCDKPEESCIALGVAADFAINNGYGRAVAKTEVLSLLRKADELGLVLQPGNSKEVYFICCCCGCCCGVLRTLKTFPKPAQWISTPFAAVLTHETCLQCGLCVERCQMDALQMQGDEVRLDPDRCIGCGLCVSTCPSRSLTLTRKPRQQQPRVPQTPVTAAIRHGRSRGKLGVAELLKMQLKSGVDRILARR